MTPAFLSHQLVDQTNEYICYLSAKSMFAFVEQVSIVNACSKGLSRRALDVCYKLPISMGMLNFAILQRGLFYAGILITGT
jgi:hypothetical protein